MNKAEVRRCAANCRFTDHARKECELSYFGIYAIRKAAPSRLCASYHCGTINRDHNLPAGPKPMGPGLAKEEALMHCVICKRGMVKSGTVQAELRIGTAHLMVPVEADVCDECGEA